MMLALVRAAQESSGGGAPFPTLWLGLGGLGTLFLSVATALIILRKYGPEVNKVQIESANAVVEMAKTAASMSAAQAEDLRKRNIALDDRLTELAARVGHYEARIQELEKVADLVEELKHERNRLMQDNRRLARRVADLEQQLALLKQEHEFYNHPDEGENPPT